MKKYYLMQLESLASQFALVDCYKEFMLSYSSQSMDISKTGVAKDDMIIGYFKSPVEKASLLLRVVSVSNNELRLKKVLESEEGAQIPPELASKLDSFGIIEISEDEYNSLVSKIALIAGNVMTTTTGSVGSSKNQIGYNKIYYGIPGCGKSWHIENKVLVDANADKKNDVFRTTFFLDYSNSDFVGQIYPVLEDDGVTYKYIPGPFTKALERALSVEENHMVYLIIEEINRGNAAAIFGDLFQLLDRLNKPRDGRVIGDSEYPISNQFIEGYFKTQNKDGKNIRYEEGNIYIPHNLTILATMNTSDQNVYPLDTAFQRRWDREKVVSKLEGSKYAELYVPGTDIKWKDFASKINIHMIEDCKDGTVTEDKNLGAYFATDAMLCYGNETVEEKKEKAMRFANNVMEYLFGTAVKFTPEILFNKSYDRYQKVYNTIEQFAFDVDQSEAFISMLTEKIANELKPNNTSPATTEDGK